MDFTPFDYKAYDSEFQRAEIVAWFFDGGDITNPNAKIFIRFKLRIAAGLIFAGRYDGFQIILGGRKVLKLEPEFVNIEDTLLKAVATTEPRDWFGAKSCEFVG